MANIFLAIPTYDGRLESGTSMVAFAAPSQDHWIMPIAKPSSLLPGNCNTLYAWALNARERYKLNWFAMLHADVIPEPFYLDKMVAEAEKHGADLLSRAIPLKDDSGVTSTAISSGKDFGQFGRLTMKQLRHESFPQTFDIYACCNALERLPHPLGVSNVPRHALLANTGCMIVRLDRPWSEELFFQNIDAIVRLEDGTFQARDLSEDWFFTRLAAEKGAKVMVTTILTINHRGATDFPGHKDWPNGIPNDCYERPTLTKELLIPVRA